MQNEEAVRTAVERASLAPIANRLARTAENAAIKAAGVHEILEYLPEPGLLKFSAALNAYREAITEHTAALLACGEHGDRLLRAVVLTEMADAEERQAMD